MVSWLEWAYCGCKDPTGSIPPGVEGLVKDPSRPPHGRNVKHKKLQALDRPHPQAVAGTPTGFGFDPQTGIFHLSYRAKAPDGKLLSRRLRTRIYVPRSHYRDGYDVRVHGARVMSKPNARYLLLKRTGPSRVSVAIRPSG
jgi:endoglycosylceramidase